SIRPTERWKAPLDKLPALGPPQNQTNSRRPGIIKADFGSSDLRLIAVIPGGTTGQAPPLIPPVETTIIGPSPAPALPTRARVCPPVDSHHTRPPELFPP